MKILHYKKQITSYLAKNEYHSSFNHSVLMDLFYAGLG